MNLREQFRLSPWMPFDHLIHKDWAQKLIPNKIRYWVCEKFDRSVMGDDYYNECFPGKEEYD
jgi:hypothetical protein